MKRSYVWLGLLFALVVGACTSDGGASPTSTSTATTSASASPSASATVAAPPALTATATSTPVGSDPIPGLFREPRFEEPDASGSLGPRPASVLPEHDGVSTVLYDIERGTVAEFGRGSMGVFSPDGLHMVSEEYADDYNDPSRLRVIDLESGAITELGESGGVRQFEGNQYIRVYPAAGALQTVFVDIETGERRAPADVEPQPLPNDRFKLAQLHIDQSGDSIYRVFEDDREVLTVVALDAKFASDDELLVLVDAGIGVGNIFVIDLDAVEATFVATTSTEPYRFSTIPLVADDGYVVWTPNYCYGFTFTGTAADAESIQLELREGSDSTPGPTVVYDRATGSTTTLTDSTFWIAGFTPDGRIVDGAFGGHSLIDPRTLTWDVVLPDGSTDVSWSPDYRYASRGEQSGHGGVCPP